MRRDRRQRIGRTSQGISARDDARGEEACGCIRCSDPRLDRGGPRRPCAAPESRAALHSGQGRALRNVQRRIARRHRSAHCRSLARDEAPEMTARCENVLVVAETIEGRASDLSYELLGLARQLVQGSGGVVSAAVLERSTAPCIQDLGARGADQVFSISDDRVTAYSAERWLAALPTLLAEHQPGHIVLGHTALGAELGPILAFRLGAAVATGCERLELNQGKLSALRPCFGNTAREKITLGTCPAVATVRARMSDPLPPAPREVKVIVVTPPTEGPPVTRVVNRAIEVEAGARLETAKIVIAGGRGVGSAEGFLALEKLASAVGGAVGGSRVACELGLGD